MLDFGAESANRLAVPGLSSATYLGVRLSDAVTQGCVDPSHWLDHSSENWSPPLFCARCLEAIVGHKIFFSPVPVTVANLSCCCFNLS